MSSKRGQVVAAIGIIVVLGVLFALPRMTDPTRATATEWKNQGLECLNNGHTNVSLHFHPHLRIIVDGVEEAIPSSAGLLKSCMAEIHTHDTSGTIHVESLNGLKEFYLDDFFIVFGQPLMRDGYELKMNVDGKVNTEYGKLLLKDKQQILLEYTKKK